MQREKQMNKSNKVWLKIVKKALIKWKRSKKTEDAKSVVMWAAVASKIVPEIFNETR